VRNCRAVRQAVWVVAEPDEDFDRIRTALAASGVSGVEDFGYFVSNPEHFRPSSFDERSAMPVLLDLLPTLTDPKAVTATAGHLRRPWAKGIAFRPLADAFRVWAPRDFASGWALGDALATAAAPAELDELLSLTYDQSYGKARQMIVYSLWRYRKDPRVEMALSELAGDPDVCLHAMSALRRTVGNDAAMPILQELSDSSPHDSVRVQARTALSKAAAAHRRSSAQSSDTAT
jgi:hypothetical protein